MNWLKVDHDKFFKASKRVGWLGPILAMILCAIFGVLTITGVINWEATGWGPGVILIAILCPIFGILILAVLLEKLLYRISSIAYNQQALHKSLEILYSEIIQKIALAEQLDSGGPDDGYLESFEFF